MVTFIFVPTLGPETTNVSAFPTDFSIRALRVGAKLTDADGEALGFGVSKTWF